MVEGEAAAVAAVVDRYGGDADMLIPMMQDLQEEYGYLPPPALRELSRRLGVPLSRIYGVATFYASFRLMPRGEHTVQLCMGTVCYIKGAGRISEALQKEFSLVPGGTSPDGKFTFAPVNCLGACALAPVLVVDGEYHGGLTVESAVGLLRRIAGGAPAPGPSPQRPAPAAPPVCACAAPPPGAPAPPAAPPPSAAGGSPPPPAGAPGPGEPREEELAAGRREPRLPRRPRAPGGAPPGKTGGRKPGRRGGGKP